jgi:biotin carboxyl carrier protein
VRVERFGLRIGDEVVDVEVAAEADRTRVRIADREVDVHVTPLTEGVYGVTCDGRRLLVHAAWSGSTWHLHIGGEVYVVAREAGGVLRERPVASGDVRAPMPGVVTRVFVRPDQVVEAGDPLYVLEAMKMETVVTAPERSRILRVRAEPGVQVEGGALVVELEPLDGGS